MNKTIGVLGGLGPMATVYFQSLLVDHTYAPTDQDHIDLIVINRATTPDRSSYILDKTKESPLQYLIEDAKKLEHAGCDALVMVCNTAHYFYDDIVKEVNIPFINMVEESVKEALRRGKKSLGLMTTTGTKKAELYQKLCDKYKLKYILSSDEIEDKIMTIIYDEIKATKPVDMNLFSEIIDYFKVKGADSILLGCTELSILCGEKMLDKDFFIDSSLVLAQRTIEFAQKRYKK